MTEGELRGLLLEKYYQRRKERLISLAPADFDGRLNEQDIQNIAGQLADHGLIHWRPNRGHDGIGGGMGTITPAGVDVVESKAAAPVDIQWSQDRSLQLPVDAGPAVAVAIERLRQAIELSGASAADRQAATALLRSFQQHPLLRTLVQGAQPDPESVNQNQGETH
ncbi:MAG TPA: hypothetical protein VHN17_12365 [Steroidobacteraceae bacterium]|jgi:hypothetical protein|nr:hypothetical protein [Steroidobacteraceae bacterium]